MNYDQWKTEAPTTEESHTCNVCGVEIDNYGICNSKKCFIADNM